MSVNDLKQLKRALHDDDEESARKAAQKLHSIDPHVLARTLRSLGTAYKPRSLRPVLEEVPESGIDNVVAAVLKGGGAPAIESLVSNGWEPAALSLSTIGHFARHAPESARQLVRRLGELGDRAFKDKDFGRFKLHEQLDVPLTTLEKLIEPIAKTFRDNGYEHSTIQHKLAIDALYCRDVDLLALFRQTVGLPEQHVLFDPEKGVRFSRFDNQADEQTITQRAERLTKILVDEYDRDTVLRSYVDDRFENGLQALDELGIEFDDHNLQEVFEQYCDDEVAKDTDDASLFLARRLGLDLPESPEMLENLINQNEVRLVERFCDENPGLVENDHLKEASRNLDTPGMAMAILDCLDPTNEQFNQAATNMVDFSFERRDHAISLLPLRQFVKQGFTPSDEFFDFLVEIPELNNIADKKGYAEVYRLVLKTGYRPPESKHDHYYELMADEDWRENGGTTPVQILARHNIQPSIELLEENSDLFALISDQLDGRVRRSIEARNTKKEMQ